MYGHIKISLKQNSFLSSSFFPFSCLFLIAHTFYKNKNIKKKKTSCDFTTPLKFSLPFLQNSSKRLFLPLPPILSLSQLRSYSSYHNQVCLLYLLLIPHLFNVFVIFSLKSFWPSYLGINRICFLPKCHILP